MNRTMVKRGIGAAVLAILAALLIGYLLKGKGQERQAVVDMSLPGAQEVKKSLNIPALKGGDSNSNLTQKTNNSSVSESVVASAEGAADKVNQATKDIKIKETAINTFKNKGNDLDFTLRPPKNEKRKFVDNINKDPEHQRRPRASIRSTSNSSSEGDVVASAHSGSSTTHRQNSSGSITRSSKGVVVASSDDSEAKRRTYRPRLEGERRRSANYGLVTEESVRKSRARKEREQRRAERKRNREREKEKQSTSASDDKKGHYSIQLLATSSSSRATNLKNVMHKEGYNSYINKTSKNGKTLFRVRIGNYTSQRAAKAAQRTMQRRYQKNQQVKNSIIVSR
ncbi:MAG TPA: SPOR domain-containing protein [Gammaproteobacteria bacterium]|nr:SPOR domain-containing protein [Gammaproteobacteria bacterium]